MGLSDTVTYTGEQPDHLKHAGDLTFTDARVQSYQRKPSGFLGAGTGTATPGTPGTPRIVRQRRFYAQYPNLWVRVR